MTVRRGTGGSIVAILFAAGMLVAAGTSAAGTPEGASRDPHLKTLGKGCINCHLTTPAPGSSPVRDSNLRFEGDIVALCSSCHGGYRHMHPVRIAVAPDMKSPENLPLDREGKITCITCHDVMERMGIHRRRQVQGRALCLNCHPDSDILAQVNWYPTHLRKGEHGRLELKVVEFRVPRRKVSLGDSVLLYYYAKNVDTGQITFGTNILYDDGSHGDRVAGDSVYTLAEEAETGGKKRRVVYTGWVLDPEGNRSNTVTLAVEYE